jgi:hypothetical protein
MKLSHNFSLEEFTFSNTAIRKGIDNTPDEKHIANLQALCVHILQPLRDKLGKEIRINSGYRCKELNRVIGGAKNSQHIEGKAADIQVIGVETDELFNFIRRNFAEYDQLIHEQKWVHISWNGFNNRNQVLYAFFGKGGVKYMPAQ